MNGKRIEVAIVADDLTGALDTAAPFASAGLATRLALDPAGNIAHDVAVVATTTESRHLAREDACARVAAAVEACAAHAPRILFKKIDSALRGNAAAEIEAALRASGRRHALIAPAVPKQGRTMRHGEVFIDGVPLRESAFANDALSPPPREPLPTLLREACPQLHVHPIARGSECKLEAGTGSHAYVIDCGSDADLDAIARFAIAHASELLLVGASGLGDALARSLGVSRMPRASSSAAHPDIVTQGIVFVIGSRTPISAIQAAELRRAGGVELRVPLDAPEREIGNFVVRIRDFELAEGAKALADVWVIRPAASPAAASSPPEVAHKLALAAAHALHELPDAMLAIVGGDTAFATFTVLGAREVVVTGELEPGIATGHMMIEGRRPLAFLTKSGGFGDAQTLVRVARSSCRCRCA